MTVKKKGRFANKGKAILGDKKPSALGEILDTVPSPPPEKNEQIEKQTGKQHTTPKKTPDSKTTDTSILKRNFKKPVNTVVRKTVTPVPDELPMKREEFRLPGSLAERLRVYSFDMRTKKTKVVIQALDTFLTKKGY